MKKLRPCASAAIMRTRTPIFAVAAMLLATGAAQANVLNMGGTRNPATGEWTGLASLETVTVGDPGNASDSRYGYGAVSYTYSIGKYEVTAGQYTEFLNAVAKTDTYSLYNAEMWSSQYGCKIQQTGSSGNFGYSVASDFANRPVNFVTCIAAFRFANWLNNGQGGAGTTEYGTYDMSVSGNRFSRGTGARWAVTSENEWYKAAYYKGGSINADYWDFAPSNSSAPGRDMSDAVGNNVNHAVGPGPYPIDSGKYTTPVGEFQNTHTAYGTFDQCGNVSEWNETMFPGSSRYRGVRGGAFNEGEWYVQAVRRSSENPGYGYADVGFRVVEIPEPASTVLLVLGGLAMLRRRLSSQF